MLPAMRAMLRRRDVDERIGAFFYRCALEASGAVGLSEFMFKLRVRTQLHGAVRAREQLERFV